MENRNEEYRKNFAECERMADNCSNAADKASWLRIAQQWVRLLAPTHRIDPPNR
jgi:hypothetical protein